MLYWKIEKEGGAPTIMDTEVQSQKARMAYAFADHMILAVTQSHGWQAMMNSHDQPHEQTRPPTLMTTREISKRACDLAELLWADMKSRGFVVEFPPPSDWTPIE